MMYSLISRNVSTTVDTRGTKGIPVLTNSEHPRLGDNIAEVSTIEAIRELREVVSYQQKTSPALVTYLDDRLVVNITTLVDGL